MIRFVVDRFMAIFVFALIIIFMGAASYFTLPKESFPEIKRPVIITNTFYAGVSAYDIESLITREIESEIDGAEGLEKLTSTSREGVSTVVAEFAGNVKVETALRRVTDRVDKAKASIPADADDPVTKELNFADQPIFIVTFSNPNGLEILENAVDFFEDEFKKVDGVLDVVVSGKLEKELEVALDPARLWHYGFAIKDVTDAIRNENSTVPGGVLKNQVKNYSLSVSGEMKDPEMFKEIIVNVQGKSAKLKELGDVSFRYADVETLSTMNGKPAVTLSIKKRTGSNLIQLADDVREVLEVNKSKLPFGTAVDIPFDSSSDVKMMVADLENSIFSGLILVLFFTIFFLGFKNAVFVSIAIPFSMLMSFTVIQMIGVTLNFVVLFSLILALGMLVDNGIVIVENIYRHAGMGKNKRQAAIDGTAEVQLHAKIIDSLFGLFFGCFGGVAAKAD